jgi:hypothetical protein
MPSAADLVANIPLPNVSIAAFQERTDFIATEVFPTIPVGPSTGTYYKFDMDAIRRDEVTIRERGTEAEDADYGLSPLTYNCGVDYSLRSHIPKEDMDQAREVAGAAVKLEEGAAEMVAEKILIKRERRFGARYWTTDIWGRDVHGAGANAVAEGTADGDRVYWSTAGSTPILDTQQENRAIRLRSGRKGNLMVLGAKVAEVLLNHASVLAHPTIMAPARPNGFQMVTLDDLATLFKVQKVIVAEATLNTAKKGQAGSGGYCLNEKSALLVHRAPRPSIRTPGAGFRFTWKGTTGNDEGLVTYSYWWQPRLAQRVETHVYESFEMAGAEFGTYFDNIVQ